MGRAREQVDGILLLHSGLYPGPIDVAESVRDFERFSRFPVYPVDASFGYPPALDRMDFRVIVLHYTMFYAHLLPLRDFSSHLAQSGDAYKVAFFQDEQSDMQARLRFCSEYGVDCVYTCLEPPHSEEVYGPVASRVGTYLPGYVSERLRSLGSKLARPDQERPIDIGYRGRKTTASWGSAAREKHDIGIEFRNRAPGLGLRLDIESHEWKRIYGRAWLRFLGRCKGTLGTESGALVPRPDGGGDLPYRTISPRHLDAASLRTCQILLEGRYSGLLEPMVHYIPLRKDFTNFDEALAAFRDPAVRRDLTENCHRDLIASGRLSYRTFMREFDEELVAAGVQAPAQSEPDPRVTVDLHPPRSRARRYGKLVRQSAFFVRSWIRRRRSYPESADTG
jgi:hypothetical protein